MLLNASEGVGCGGKVRYSNILATAGSLRASGPNEALLVLALLCIVFMKNRYLLKVLELTRFALAHERATLLARMPELLRLFLTRQDLSAPDSEVLKKISCWLRLIAALLQNEGAARFQMRG